MNDKKERIVESAVKLFLDKGFEKTTISEVSKNANVGKGTVYEYFSSKEELRIECAKQVLNFYHKGFKEIMSSDKTFKEKLFSYIEYTKSLALKVKNPVNFMDTASLSDAVEIKKHFLEFRKNLSNELEKSLIKAMENGEIRNDSNIQAMTYFVLVSVMQIVVEVGHNSMITFDINDVFDLIYNGIGN